MSENGNVVKKSVTAVEHFNPDDSAALFMQTSLFDQVQRAAMLLSRSNLVPPHLRGDDKVADCFLVIEQAMRWRMSPFAVAQSTYVLSGKLGYEGKLIAAVVNASPRLWKSLNYKYSGVGDDRKVVVSGTLTGETAPREIDGTVKQWAMDRNPKWKDMPDQMLAYRGAREWARRHLPEVMLGVYADDELEQIASSPTTVSVTPESLDDFVKPDKVEVTEDPKGKAVEAEIVEPPKQEIKEIKAPVGKAPDATSGENTTRTNKDKKTPRDATIDELFG